MSKSLDILNRELAKTLKASDSAPKVVCVRGPWGVGKTFAWDKFLLGAKKDQLLPLNNYAYVSLFGLETLGQLKAAVSENTISKELIGQKLDIQTIKNNQKAAATSYLKRYGKTFAQLWRPTATEIFDSWAFALVNSQLICFDDIERRGERLRLADFLGLVSDLAERRECRIVVILNDEELSAEDQKVFKAYHEKVIDVSIRYTPTAAECAEVALKADGIGAEISKRTIALDVSNIRIIKKAERLAEEAALLLKPYHQVVLKQAFDTLVLFGWAHYSKRDDVIQFALTKRGRGLYGTNREKLSEEEKKLDDLLDKYGFANSDDFDRTLLEAIKSGYFDEVALHVRAKEQDGKQRQIENNTSLEGAWRRFHDSLQANEDEVVDGLLKGFYANVDSIAPQNFAGTVSLLKELGRTAEAADVVAAYFAIGRDKRSYYDLSEHHFGADITDPDIRKAFQDAYDAFVDDRDPLQLVKDFVEDKGMDIDDWSRAAAVDPDQLRAYFKSLEAYPLRRTIEALLGLKLHAPPQRTVYDKALAALQQIAKELTLNCLRLRKYKIGP